MKRRHVLQAALAALALPAFGSQAGAAEPLHLQYLEIVTPEVDAVCDLYCQVHGVTFGEPDPDLGGARTAALPSGGWVGIRPPLRSTETPVVRPYMRVDDLEAAVAAAVGTGAKVAIRSMQVGRHGRCAIVIRGGIEAGLWQVG